MGQIQCCDISLTKINIHHNKQQFQIFHNLQQPISQLKSKIIQQKKLPQSDFANIRLIYNGKQLTNNSSTLLSLSYRIDQDHLNLIISSSSSKSINITIKNINFTERIQIQSTQLVKILKQKLIKSQLQCGQSKIDLQWDSHER